MEGKGKRKRTARPFMLSTDHMLFVVSETEWISGCCQAVSAGRGSAGCYGSTAMNDKHVLIISRMHAQLHLYIMTAS